MAIPDADRRLQDYPASVLGRHASARDDRDGARCEPELIIADEPTTALDVTVQAQILALLKELTRKTNSAMILITHDLGVVARYADRVAVMYAGRVVETADARSLYARPSHPYSRGLLASIPGLDGVAGGRLPTIDGQPPDLAHLPPGCSFAPRCPLAEARCTTARPPLEPLAGHEQHLRACFVDG